MKYRFDSFEETYKFLTYNLHMSFAEAAKVMAYAQYSEGATWEDNPDFPVRAIVKVAGPGPTGKYEVEA